MQREERRDAECETVNGCEAERERNKQAHNSRKSIQKVIKRRLKAGRLQS